MLNAVHAIFSFSSSEQCALKSLNSTRALCIFLFVLYPEAIRFHLGGFLCYLCFSAKRSCASFFRFRFTPHQANNSFHMFQDIIAIAMRVCVVCLPMMMLLLLFSRCYLDRSLLACFRMQYFL